MTNPSTPNKTVLVTGGAGYIGSHSVLALLDAGWPVVVIDNLTTGHRSAVPTDVPFYQYDAGDREFVGEVIRKHGVAAILHFAGSIVVPESVTDPLKYYRNNTAQTRDLVETAIRQGVPHFIFSSTAAVYGEPQSSPVSEDSPALPINPYGMSKRMSEIMLADTARAHALNYCALRYFNVAGADPQGRAGQSSADATHLIKVAVQAALGQRSHVAVYGDDFATPDGTGVRDYIHVSDLAHAHVLALEALIAQPKRSLVLNCGYGRGFSVTEVLDAVERVAGVTLDRRRAPRRSGDPAELVAANAALLGVLPWQPRYAELDTIVAHALAWERKLVRQAAA
jgi:UDP-glucose 4-epimerase